MTQVESEELGVHIVKRHMDYYHDLNQKFKKYSLKRRKNLTTHIIEKILIKSFREFAVLAEEELIMDECVVKVYFYIHGLRDSIKTNKEMDKEWDDINKLHTEFVNMLKTFGQYQGKAFFGKIKRIIAEAVAEYNKVWVGRKAKVYYEGTGLTQIFRRILGGHDRVSKDSSVEVIKLSSRRSKRLYNQRE